MKKLSRIRLINWYHMEDETLPIAGSVLLTGDNGSGKSTILDAIQFALVADLSQVRFNQAANENAARSLQGYTRWMTNSGGSKESHQYNRGDCASYVLLEFLEQSQGSEAVFTVGVVVDSFKDGRDPRRLHFAAHQSRIADIPVFREGSRIPLPTAEFRRLMGTRKGFFGSHEPGAFRDDLLTRLGKLSPDFTKVLVKAQAFKPLGQVHQFVMDFLLDAKPLETQSLQSNLAHYKALELKAAEAERRVAQLESIRAKSVDLARVREEARQCRYLELRARAGVHEAWVAKHESSLGSARSDRDRFSRQAEQHSQSVSRCELEIGSVYRSLSQNSAYMERERVRSDLSVLQKEIDKTSAAIVRGEGLVTELERIERELRGVLADESVEAVGWQETAYRMRAAQDRVQGELEQLKIEGERLQSKLDDLKKGIRPYPKETKILKQLIEDKLGAQAPLFCELLEVEDERWQSAVEGYLNTRRFDIVPELELFQKALGLYEKMKVQLQIHGAGLVDSERVLGARAHAKEGSLAEVVSSRNPCAKAYADFLMGDVMRCESEKELRRHSRSITPTCMVYQNHAARQTAFHIYEAWHIGARGHASLKDRAEKELAAVFEAFKAAAAAVEKRRRWTQLAEQAAKTVGEVAGLAVLRESLVGFKADHVRISAHLDAIDTHEIAALESRLLLLSQEKNEANASLAAANREVGQASARAEQFEQSFGEACQARDLEFAQIAAEFSAESARAQVAELESRYQDQLAERRLPEKIEEIYESQRKNRETQASNLLQDLTLKRSEYNNVFGFSGPALGEEFTPYLEELDAWKNSHLPDYRQKILAAKDGALQQLMEDIVHKLRENLDLIPDQFDQINRTLRGFHFGFDQYQFTYRIKREFESFEKLIREAAQYERQPLFETNWRERFRDGGALEALFASLVSGSSSQVEEELRQYSDYREYYEYDLKILHSDGTSSLFSQVNRWKSGGETQAPYYIAVLASLYRLYRLTPEQVAKQRGTIGLVILDEAFNKMDEDRLKATLAFTRKLGLQLIMATPKERAEFIIPHVESCFIVAKDPQTGRAFVADFHQEMDSDIDQPTPGSPASSVAQSL